MEKVLVVDDELNMRLVLNAMIKKEGYEVALASDGRQALKMLQEGSYAAIITDLKMPHLDGMSLLSHVERDYPNIPVIMITAYGTIATAVDALKKGAFDYITKPFEQDELMDVIRKATKANNLSMREPFISHEEVERNSLLWRSASMQSISDTIRQVAPAATTIFITGETGTGKELIAGAIHRHSLRARSTFIKINCAAISENLMESELFGYERGAFTGAVVTKPGKFELAHRGTLFLDEVGELPKDMQVKLLRVLQEQEFERVGGLRTIKIDVRLITATNRNLAQDVREGKFREDLFYRLNVFPIHVPPLRDRKDDVLPLADFFLQKFNKKLGKAVKGIASSAQDKLVAYPWPGNVRELENALEAMVLLCKTELLTMDYLPEAIKTPFLSAYPVLRESGLRPTRERVKDQQEEIEKRAIATVLDECGGNVTKAAIQLGMSRKGLQLKMIKYDLRK
ncbi:MAG: sigma-54 dependent transcriptional regulator [Syntrophales bacterium]